MTLQKSANRPSSKEEEHIFVERRDDLFNISQANVLELLKIDEDKQFLVNQRKSVIDQLSLTNCYDKMYCI